MNRSKNAYAKMLNLVHTRNLGGILFIKNPLMSFQYEWLIARAAKSGLFVGNNKTCHTFISTDKVNAYDRK